jgi:hypothetical protein
VDHLSCKISALKADLKVADQAVVIVCLIILDPWEEERLASWQCNTSHINQVFFGNSLKVESVSASLNKLDSLLFLEVSVDEPDKASALEPVFSLLKEILERVFLQNSSQLLPLKSGGENH